MNKIRVKYIILNDIWTRKIVKKNEGETNGNSIIFKWDCNEINSVSCWTVH